MKTEIYLILWIFCLFFGYFLGFAENWLRDRFKKGK